MFRPYLLPVCVGTLTSLCVFGASAQVEDTADSSPELEPAVFAPTPVLIEPTGLVAATIHHSGETVLLENRLVTRPMCGSDMATVTVEDLANWNRTSQQHFEEGFTVLDTTPIARGGTGLNLVLNLSGNVPAAALPAIAEAEAYIESQFGDPVTIFIDVDFFNFGNGGVIGSTGSNSTNISYSAARAALIAGKDGDDTIQDSLPTGSTIPVRYTSTSTSISNENRVFFNRATYEAAVGSIGGTDASMNFNTQFNFDYDPSNGVPGSATDFQSVFIHEVGHALGFTSNAGFGMDIEALDLYRFARSDSVNGVNGDWDPDTLAEFQTTARMVDGDVSGTNDDGEVDANSDLISVEYRMSDGNPNQTSHFNEGVNGIMDPTIGGGQSFFPDFYRTSDLTMFDAIGWDYPPSVPASFERVTPTVGENGVPVQTVFEWEAATSATSYRLIVDNNSNFASPVIDISGDSSFVTYVATPGELNPMTTYFWTVEASNSVGTTDISPLSASFTTTVEAVTAFALLSPANFAVVSVTPDLDWGDSANADEYLLEVSTNGAFSGIVLSTTVTVPTSQFTVLPGTLSPEVEYFWRVTASNSGSSLLSVPSARRFTTEETALNTCVGDFDNDGDVDLGDFGVFGAAFNSMTGDANYDATADFDNDGDVDLGDFGVFGGEFGRTDCLD